MKCAVEVYALQNKLIFLLVLADHYVQLELT